MTLGSLLVPYPQYGTITQTNTNGRQLRTHMLEIQIGVRFAFQLLDVPGYWTTGLLNYCATGPTGAGRSPGATVSFGTVEMNA